MLRKYLVTFGNASPGCYEVKTIFAKNKEQAIFQAGVHIKELADKCNKSTVQIHLLTIDYKGRA